MAMGQKYGTVLEIKRFVKINLEKHKQKGGHLVTKRRSPNVEYQKELLLKERIHSLWEQILSFESSFHFKTGRNY